MFQLKYANSDLKLNGQELKDCIESFDLESVGFEVEQPIEVKLTYLNEKTGNIIDIGTAQLTDVPEIPSIILGNLDLPTFKEGVAFAIAKDNRSQSVPVANTEIPSSEKTATQSNDGGCNGWKNRQTWLVNMHINANEPLYETLRYAAWRMKDEKKYDYNDAISSMIDLIEHVVDVEIQYSVPLLDDFPMAADWIGWLGSDIDYTSIAAGFLDEFYPKEVA